MIGKTLGSYKVVSKLGEGGMGVVYVAEHPLLKKKAVAKLLRPELSQNDQVIERFFNEARAAALIRHPGIVDVFDFGYDKDGSAFILMEFLDGENLACRLRRGRQSADFTVYVGKRIASAVGAAHEQGIIHRDLKPDNVFLVPDREAPHRSVVKVLDFGIAKLAGDVAGSVKTRTGAAMGTPAYMAPEQFKNARQLDHRADVYSVGCILFEMVCGRPPFVVESLGEMVSSHLFEPPPAPRSIERSIPESLEAVILRSLEKRPDARQSSMDVLFAELSGKAVAVGEAKSVPGLAAQATASPGAIAPTLRPTDDAALARGAPGQTATPGDPSDAAAPGLAVKTTLGASAGQLAPPVAPASKTVAPEKTTRRRWLAYGLQGGAVVALGAALTFGLLFGGSDGTGQAGNTPPNDSGAGQTGEAHAATTAAAPAGDVEPPAPAQVTLVIESDPPGADVYRAFDGVLVGRTRYETKMAPITGKAVYVLKLDGYDDERVELFTDRDDQQKLTLTPRSQKTRTARKKRHRKKRSGSKPAQATVERRSEKPSDGTLAPTFGKKNK